MSQTAQTAHTDDIKKLNKLIQDVKFCMLTTKDKEGRMHSRPMCIAGEMDVTPDNKSAMISFFTYKDSMKCSEMAANNCQVNLSFSDPKSQNYVSISGTGTISQDKDDMKKRWSEANKAWFPQGLDTPGVSLLKVAVDKAEFWDAPSSLVAHAIGFVKSQLTGELPSMGTHKAVSMGGKAEHKEQGGKDEAKMEGTAK